MVRDAGKQSGCPSGAILGNVNTRRRPSATPCQFFSSARLPGGGLENLLSSDDFSTSLISSRTVFSIRSNRLVIERIKFLWLDMSTKIIRLD